MFKGLWVKFCLTIIALASLPFAILTVYTTFLLITNQGELAKFRQDIGKLFSYNESSGDGHLERSADAVPSQFIKDALEEQAAKYMEENREKLDALTEEVEKPKK